MKQKLFVCLLIASLPCLAIGVERDSPSKKPTRSKQKIVKNETADEPIPDSDSCGLGWQVTQRRTLSAVTTRGTTNVTVPPVFGMTTGTMGCAKRPLSMREVEAARYAFNNFDNLSVEMAEGHGEFLTGFAQTLGCSDSNLLSQRLQNHYRSIMNSGKASSLQMLDNVKLEIKNDTLLAISCSAV